MSTGSGLLFQSRGFLNCMKDMHPPWWWKYRIASLGGALNCFSLVIWVSCIDLVIPILDQSYFTKSRICRSVSSYRKMYNRISTLLFSFLTCPSQSAFAFRWMVALSPHRDTCLKYWRGCCLLSLVSVEITLADKLDVTISMQAINMIEVVWSYCRASLSHAERTINISDMTAKM